MKNVYLITWKQFEKRTMIDKMEIVKTDDDALNRMQILNAEKRLTTTDYRIYNLSELLEKHNFQITEKE